jgi:hypothetical protein
LNAHHHRIRGIWTKTGPDLTAARSVVIYGMTNVLKIEIPASSATWAQRPREYAHLSPVAGVERLVTKSRMKVLLRLRLSQPKKKKTALLLHNPSISAEPAPDSSRQAGRHCSAHLQIPEPHVSCCRRYVCGVGRGLVVLGARAERVGKVGRKLPTRRLLRAN